MEEKRKKRKKVSVIEMREWLYQYELGKSKKAIANDTERDERTIDKYLAQARKEADLRAARKELLTRVLMTHNNELLAVVKNIVVALQVPVSQLELRQDDNGNWFEIPFPAAKAYPESDGTRIVLQDENTKRWKLLSEHLGSETLLLKLANWKKAMASHIDFRKALKVKLIELMQGKTGLSVIKESYDKPTTPVLYQAVGDILVPVYINRAFSIPDGTDPEHNLKIDIGGYVSLLGTGTYLGWLSTEGGKLLDKMIEALYELGQSQEFLELESNYPSINRVTNELQDEFEDLTLLGYIAGRCSVCEKLER
jgi:hypothetical protein